MIPGSLVNLSAQFLLGPGPLAGALSASPRPAPSGSFVEPFSLGSPSPVLSLLHTEAWGPPQPAGLKLLCASESPDGDVDGHGDRPIE